MKKFDISNLTDQQRKNIHVIFIALIAIIIVFVTARIMIWNIGHDSQYNPNELLEGFDTECNDLTFYVNSDQRNTMPQDDINTILFLGNNQITDGMAGEQVPNFVAEYTKGHVINCGFSGSIAASYANGGNPNDAFSFYFVTLALLNNDFSFQDTNLPLAECADETYPEVLNKLKQVSMEQVDTLVICYDATDYFQKVGLWNPLNSHDIATFQGALLAGVDLIRQMYPHIRIILSSPTYALMYDENGNLQGGDLYDAGNGDLSVYVTQEGAVGSELCVSFIDHFYGTVHADNYTSYLTDNVHLNKEGRELVAKRIAHCILN